MMLLLNLNSKFTTDFIKIDNRNLLSINASSSVTPDNSWDKKLYQPIPKEEGKNLFHKINSLFCVGK